MPQWVYYYYGFIEIEKESHSIPTPGQTEQEYLAAHMMQQGCFPYLKQEDFEISKAIDMFKSFHFRFPFHEKQFEKYRETVTSLASIPQRL
jgi:hypothetical protein